MILAGDIGGTKTKLALYEVAHGRLSLQVEQKFESSKHESLMEVVEEFLGHSPLYRIEKAVFGIAGPVIEGRCHATNLPWIVDSSELRHFLAAEKVYLINDLEATAYGMLYLPDDALFDLNPDAEISEGNRAVIAAGTGLGEAMLFYQKGRYHPIASEGGHTDFAPVTTQQDALLQWLRKRYPEHVSYERILSGSGIAMLYTFLSESGFAPEPASMLDASQERDLSAAISRCAIEENDPLCIETLRLFAEIYAAEAGNLALKSLSLGGIYIGGGIAPKILPFLNHKSFLKSFAHKGRFRGMLEKMRIRISLDPDTALLGAAYYATDKL